MKYPINPLSAKYYVIIYQQFLRLETKGKEKSKMLKPHFFEMLDVENRLLKGLSDRQRT